MLAESVEVWCGNQGVALLAENLDEKGFGNGGVALLAKSVEVGCGNQGVALLAKNLEEKGCGTASQKCGSWMWQSRCGTAK